MPGEIVHFEIPADNMAQGREFWGSLFGWRFEAFPGPFEYHVARISAQTGGDPGHGARRARAGTELEERLHLERLGGRVGRNAAHQLHQTQEVGPRIRSSRLGLSGSGTNPVLLRSLSWSGHFEAGLVDLKRRRRPGGDPLGKPLRRTTVSP
jgi:hypothetical protein